MKKILCLTFVLLCGVCIWPLPAQAANQSSAQTAKTYDVDVRARFDDAAGMVYFDIWFVGGQEADVEIIVNGVSYVVNVVGTVDGALQLPGYSWNTSWWVGEIKVY